MVRLGNRSSCLTMVKLVVFLFLFITLKVSASVSFGIGQRDYVFEDKSRNRKLVTHIWYPIDSKLKTAPIKEGSPFLPVTAAVDAPLAKNNSSTFPILLLSHGSGGRANKLFWITQHFVHSGIIVVGVDHPGNMTGDNSADGLMRIWNRPQYLSYALDRLSETSEFKSHLDMTRVAALGHSAGGTTALLLGGARLSSTKFTSPTPNCAGTKDPYYATLCEQMKGLDLHSFPRKQVEGDYSDARVKAIVALDPGMAQSFDDDSLKKLKAKPYLFIADKLNAPQDEIYSKEFLKKFPIESREVVSNSFHMTFLQACNPDFPKDDPELKELCINNNEKLLIQAKVAAKSLAFVRKNWEKQ